MKLSLFSIHKNHHEVAQHIIYWLVFVCFFTLVWGTYDNDYFRNFVIQLLSLPSRLILVYVTIHYLFPSYFLKKNYSKFIFYFIILLLIVSVCVQRGIYFYIIQPNYLQNFQNSNFFAVTEIMNTILDVNLGVIVPLGYIFFKSWQKSNQKTIELEKEYKLQFDKDEFIYLKVEKSLQKVSINEIIFIESLKNYIKVKTTDRELIVYKSITAVKELLPEEDFLRVHRSYVVSLNFIDSFSPSKLSLKGITIPIGRKYKDDVKSILGYF